MKKLNITLHLSRYFPRYKMDTPKTSLYDMKNAYEFLSKYLNNIYLGNLTAEELEFCLNI